MEYLRQTRKESIGEEIRIKSSRNYALAEQFATEKPSSFKDFSVGYVGPEDQDVKRQRGVEIDEKMLDRVGITKLSQEETKKVGGLLN